MSYEFLCKLPTQEIEDEVGYLKSAIGEDGSYAEVMASAQVIKAQAERILSLATGQYMGNVSVRERGEVEDPENLERVRASERHEGEEI